MAGIDTFHARALEMISSTKVRDAFDINKESQQVREKYGKKAERFLQARRLIEAGVSVVTLSVAGTMFPGGDWDTHAGGDQKSETNLRATSAASCPNTTRSSTPSSPTCTTAVWTRTWPW